MPREKRLRKNGKNACFSSILNHQFIRKTLQKRKFTYTIIQDYTRKKSLIPKGHIMAKLLFRTQLLCSNPSTIRRFEIDDRRSVAALLQTIAIVYGIDEVVKINLLRGTTIISDSTLIKDKLSPVNITDPASSGFSVSCTIPLKYADYYSIDEQISNTLFTFSLDLETDKESWLEEKKKDNETKLTDADDPRLIHYRGLNIIPYGRNFNESNDFMKSAVCGSLPYIRNIGYIELSNYLVDMDEINNQLKNQITLGRKKVKIDRDKGISLRDIIDCLTIADMKRLVLEQRLPISTSGSKAQIVTRIKDHFNTPVFWKQLLEEMTLSEYEDFVDFALNGKNLQGFDLPSLQEYDLTAYLGRSKLVVPMEFLLFYQDFINREGDEELILSKKLRRVGECCRLLYGVFNIEMFIKVAEIIGLNITLTEDMAKKFLSHAVRISSLTESIYYSEGDFRAEEISKIITSQRFLMKKYYIPSKADLENLTKNGYLMEPKHEEYFKQHLRTISRNRMDIYEMEYCIRLSYYLMRLGSSEYKVHAALMDIFKQHYYSITEKDRVNLLKFLGNIMDDIRMVENLGYTNNEVLKMMQTSQPVMRRVNKISPNEPCPCGSGKKYKYCHGRK